MTLTSMIWGWIACNVSILIFCVAIALYADRNARKFKDEEKP